MSMASTTLENGVSPTYPGTLIAKREVDLVARVDGYLLTQNYTPGDYVREGTVHRHIVVVDFHRHSFAGSLGAVASRQAVEYGPRSCLPQAQRRPRRLNPGNRRCSRRRRLRDHPQDLSRNTHRYDSEVRAVCRAAWAVLMDASASSAALLACATSILLTASLSRARFMASWPCRQLAHRPLQGARRRMDRQRIIPHPPTVSIRDMYCRVAAWLWAALRTSSTAVSTVIL